MTVTTLHRYRLTFLTRQETPASDNLRDLFRDHEVRCAARSAAEACRRFVPAHALAPQIVREA
jgi:hypothetical protein